MGSGASKGSAPVAPGGQGAESPSRNKKTPRGHATARPPPREPGLGYDSASDTDDEPPVWLLFSKRDAHLAQHLSRHLAETLDTALLGDDSPATASSARLTGIRNAQAVVAIVSPNFEKNRACHKEHDEAQSHGIPIVPVVTTTTFSPSASSWLSLPDSPQPLLLPSTTADLPAMAAALSRQIQTAVANAPQPRPSPAGRNAQNHPASSSSSLASSPLPDTAAGAWPQTAEETRALFARLRTRGEDVPFCRQALLSLLGLSLDEDGAGWIVEADGLAAVVGVLQRHVAAHADLAVQVCWLFSHLAAWPRLPRLIDDAGGTRVVVKAMELHQQHARVQVHAAMALEALVVSDTLGSEYGIDALLAALRIHPKHDEVQLHALRALHALVLSDAVSARYKLEVLDKGALDCCQTAFQGSAPSSLLHAAAQAAGRALTTARKLLRGSAGGGGATAESMPDFDGAFRERRASVDLEAAAAAANADTDQKLLALALKRFD